MKEFGLSLSLSLSNFKVVKKSVRKRNLLFFRDKKEI
jgi:hypothetical protein